MNFILKIASYIRYPFAALFFVIATAVLSAAMVPFSLIGGRRGEQLICYLWAMSALKPFNIRVRGEGFENMPAGGFLFLFNHTSWFDIWILHGYIHRISRFGAKAELFKIPLLATAMRVAGVLPIAREKRTDVFKVYREAETRVAKGESFFLAPEGTRQKDPVLGPFKKGPFIFAINAKMPIVPIVIWGAHSIMPKGTFLVNWGHWCKEVYFKIMPPISIEGYSMDNIDQLQARVRESMEQGLAELMRR